MRKISEEKTQYDNFPEIVTAANMTEEEQPQNFEGMFFASEDPLKQDPYQHSFTSASTYFLSNGLSVALDDNYPFPQNPHHHQDVFNLECTHLFHDYHYPNEYKPHFKGISDNFQSFKADNVLEDFIFKDSPVPYRFASQDHIGDCLIGESFYPSSIEEDDTKVD